MMRPIRQLGLALVFALAITVTAGGATALASGFEADAEPADVVASGSWGTMILDDHTMSCKLPELDGELEAGSESLSFTAADTQCAYAYGEPTMEMNGCELIFHVGEEESPGVFAGTMDIGPAECGPITRESTYWSCIVEIGPQNNLQVTYENVGQGSSQAVEINLEAAGIKYTQSKTKGFGCTPGTFENGVWSGTWETGALHGEAEDPTGWRAVAELATDLYVSDGEPQTEIQADHYPSNLTGSQSPDHELAVGGGTLSCEDIGFTGELTGADTAVDLLPAFAGCGFSPIGNATVTINGCGYTLNIDNGGPPYAGDVDIVCPGEEGIEIVAKALGAVKCTITIPAQSDLEGVVYENTEANSVLQVDLELSGVAYHQQEGTGFGRCKGSGDFEDGVYTGGITLRASY